MIQMMATLIKIILGLLGLGVVVFIHELGHFLAARLVKIDVEAFSIGWGNPILKKKVGMVEYRLGMFPLGGYCKMKGSSDYGTTEYKEAWENMRNGVKPDKSSFLGASPAARILVSFAGPFFNLVFAVILLSILWGAGFQMNTLENKIILASQMDGETYPADSSGLQTGDRIIDINGKEISNFNEMRENIALNPNKTLPIKVERDGKIISLLVTPDLDKSTGIGKIGVSPWINPVIGVVLDGSPAQKAGLLSEDVILSVNGKAINNTLELSGIMEEKPEKLVLEYQRNGTLAEAEFSKEDIEEGKLGIGWKTIQYRTPKLSIPAAAVKGVSEGFNNLAVYVKSLRLLFMGIDLTQAVSGPVRITYLMGDVATQGFRQGLGEGLRSLMEFIAIISIALFVMNLLPLPILDGGMIILFLVELIRRKPAHPRVISIFQTCGIVIIFSLFVFAVFGDILFFVRK